MSSPLFDAPQAWRTPERSEGRDALRPDTFRRPRSRRPAQVGVVRPQPGKPGEARSRLKRASTVAFVLAILAAPAIAAPLTVNEIPTIGEARDPKNAYGNLALDAWAVDVKQLEASGDRNFGFLYVPFKIGDVQYLASMLDSRLCSRTNCEWIVQRLTPEYREEARSPKIQACAERNKVDLSGDTLTICGKEISLP